jgi:multidrug efflux system membrane fusion protein
MTMTAETGQRKKIIQWTVAVVVLLLLVLGVVRALSARKAQQRAITASSIVKDQGVVELTGTDIVNVQTLEVVQGIPISGTLKAFNSAVIKARVAGELQGLTVREGDFVKAGQVIARIDSSEYQSRLRQAREQADSAKAQVDVAQRQYDNNKALVDQGFISRTALDTSQNNLQAAQANYRAATAAVDLARKGLDDTVLRAPISGVVAQRLAQPGERVGIDARVIEIVDLSRLELEASISASDSLQVRIGQPAQLQVEGSAQPVTARVARINPSTQAGSRSVLVYLTIDNPAGLRQGLFAQGTLAIGQVETLAVPLAAVRTDKPAPYVQLVEDNKIVHRGVQLGSRGQADKEEMVAVTGVASGAYVVRGSVGPLREGTAVRFTGAAEPRRPGASAAANRPAVSPSP